MLVSFRVVGMAVLMALAANAFAPLNVVAQPFTDRVRLQRGSEAGEIKSASSTELTIEQSGRKKTIPVNEILSVVFGDEPTELTQARLNAKNGGYVNAQERLRQIERGDIKRDLVRDDVEFYQVYVDGKLALTGSGEISGAGRRLNDFVRSHPQSFHYFDAVELMGDLLMAAEKFPAAEKQYAELATAPWPEYKTRAGVLLGRSLQAQDKHADAIAQFDVTLSGVGAVDNDAARSATLGKAVSLAESGRLDEAVKLIEDVIQATDPEQRELQARAYNALGDCYQRAGRTKDALLAYLHVDVLYSTVPEAHAEALSHLVPLWEAVGQANRAREAREVLQQRYAGTKWAK